MLAVAQRLKTLSNQPVFARPLDFKAELFLGRPDSIYDPKLSGY